MVKEFLLTADREKGIMFEQLLNAFTSNITEDLRKERVVHLYNMLCDGNTEKGIDADDVKRLVKVVGESLCMSEIHEMMNRLSNNGKTIGFDEFYEILCVRDTITEMPEE